jgi:hypothetical protein
MTKDQRAAASWLARVQHDLVKRMLWVARDHRELGRSPRPGELVATLIDDEGQPLEAHALWERLAEEAPAGLGLGEFDSALRAAVAAAEQNDLEGVLALEGAFEKLRNQGR